MVGCCCQHLDSEALRHLIPYGGGELGALVAGNSPWYAEPGDPVVYERGADGGGFDVLYRYCLGPPREPVDDGK